MSLRTSLGLPAVAVLALVLGGCALQGDDDSPHASQAPADRATPRADGSAGSTPTRPPARICGSKGLDGPATRPQGARRVTPSQRLDRMVGRAPRGATFWLTAGVHRIGSGQYDQITPKQGQTFIGAPGAIIDGQHRNQYAFTGHATHVRIEHLTIQNFGGRAENNNEGVVNHDAGHQWQVLHNTVRDNAGAGVFLGSGNVVAHNCLVDNGQYGFSVYERHGVHDVTLRHNEIAGNNTDNWEERRPYCGCSGGGKFWETRNARVIGNWIHGNHSVGLWADTNNTGFLVQGNYISGNRAEGFIYETSYNAAIIHNTFARNALVAGPKNSGFPTPALYISESGSDVRAGKKYGDTFQIAHNRFIDNWTAVMAWENADRFAGSPANTSSGYTTLVNPRVATISNCRTPSKIKRSPWFDDCRWKTQNLRVHHNKFKLTPSRIGSACTAKAGCGYVGLVSNYGSYPDWSPYKAEVVEDNITFQQDNRWFSNRYVGPWRFQVHELGNTVSWSEWREAPYRQDKESALD